MFETILLQAGCAKLWPLHLKRLYQGLAVLQLEMPNLDWLQKVRNAAKVFPESVLKLVVYRSGIASGYGSDNSSVDVAAILKPYHRLPYRALEVGISDYPLISDPRLARIKHLNRLPQVMAGNEAKQKKLDELLLLDANGDICEAISSNLFVLINGQWLTPDLGQCGVEGVLRRYFVEQLAKKHHIPCVVGKLHASDLEFVAAAFLSNSVRRIQPVKTLLGKTLNLEPSETIMKLVNQELNA